jgi:translocation and assembly module TamA
VRFDVVPGARYRLGAIALGNLAETSPEDFPLLRGRFGLQPGDPLSSDAIVAARTALDGALADNGYAFAAMGEPELVIDHRREEGDLTLPVATGGKYRFGALNSSLGRFLPASHLQRIARFRQGDIYSRSQVEDLRRAILATGLVASVAVSPRETAPPAPGAPGEVALDLAMTRAPLRTLAGSAGYESGDGARLEVSWEHRNLFPPEGMLRLRGIAGTKEQLVGATFRRNNFLGRDQVLTADLYANNVTRTAFEARTLAFTATFEKLTTLIFQKPWTWSVSGELLATEEREGAVGGVRSASKTYFIGALPLRAAYDASDDLLDPTRGWRVSLRVSPELSVQQGRRSTYARVQADASAYLPVGKAVVLAGRVRLGTIPGTAIDNIAPSRRFYAGGGGSVRGFGYQLIGPRDSLGDPSGGRSLTEVSLEARIGTGLFGGALSVVPFIDAGSVDERVTPGWRDMRYGAGLGVRYKTGFGPIRIDVGTPLNHRPGESRIGVTVALGQAF